MNIFDAHITGSLSVSSSAEISGDLTVLGTINATVSGTTTNAISASHAASYTLTSSFHQFTSSYTTGSFTGSFKGDGAELYNIPASGVTGLNLNKIISGSVSASISPNRGFEVNTDATFTGSVNITGSIFLNGNPIGTGKLDETTFNTYTSSVNTYTGNTSSTIATLSTTSSVNSLSSSIATTDLNQNNRLDSLETASGSIRTDFNTYTGSLNNFTSSASGRLTSLETTTGSLNSKVLSLETESGSIRTTLNSFTSSINTTIKSKLDSENVVSGSSQISITGTTGYSTFSSSIATTDLNQSNRIDSLEGVSGSYATTGSNLFKGTQTHSGSIVPSVDNLYDLGSLTHQWRDVFISSGSLYIDGTKVISSTTQELTITTDTGQSLKILEGTTDSIVIQVADGDIELKSSGDGDILLDPTNGKIMLKGPVEVLSGQKIQSSVGGTPVVFANDIVVSGSIDITGTIEGINLTDFSSSVSGKLTSLEGMTSSLSTFTSSASSRLSSIETSTGSLNSFTSSIDTTIKNKINTEGVISGSVQVTLSSTTGYSTFSSSVSSSIGSLSSSVATTTSGLSSSIGSLSSSVATTNLNQNNRLDSIEGKSGSYATTGSNIFKSNQTISGSVIITENLTVFGSSSITYVTSSQLRVDDNIITVNTASPGSRFGGLEVHDSGSVGIATGSILWDSVNNRWIYQQTSESTYGGGMLLSGPRSSGSLGSELSLTSGRVAKSAGGDHLNDSNITDNGTDVSINSNTNITGSLLVTNTIVSQMTPLVSGSSQISYLGLSNIPTGIVSGSGQIPSLLPAGVVSGSSQVLNGTTIHSGTFFNGISVVSGSGQISFNGITDKPTLVSGSSQVLLSSGVWSGSAQLPSGIISGSSQLPSGIVSGSSQVDLTATTNYSTGIKTRLNAEGVISGSSQVLSGTGIWSGSAQLPAGTVSGSSQITLSSTTGFGSYLNQAVLTTSTPTFSTVSATTFTGALVGNASTASSVNFANIATGSRNNYDLDFKPGTDSYAGFRFSKSTSANNAGDAGYLLLRGSSDNDIYTAEGITLVADGGWLTLAQRTTASRGIRLMTGSPSSVTRLQILTDGTIKLSSLTSNGFVKTSGSDGTLSIDTTTYFSTSSQVTLSSTTGFGSYLNQAVLTTSTPTFAELTVTSNQDGKLTLRVPSSGDSNDWNYISFVGANGTRDMYFGTDSGGNPTWYRDDNGVNIGLGSVATVNGTQIVTNSGTWGISVSGNAGTSTTTPTLSASGTLTTQTGSGTLIHSSPIVSSESGLFSTSDNSNSVITFNRHPGNYYSQLGFNSSGTIFYRSFNNTAINTSQAWKTIIDSGNIGSQTVATAGNATTAGGFTPSQTSGTANRIVVADGNGYIINNYFNASGGGSERNASGMGYFAGHNTSDYYYRSYTAAAAAALLSGQSMNISGTATNITQYTINQSVGTGNSPTFAGLTSNSNATLYRDVYINGGTGGNFGNRLLIGTTTATYTLQDTNIRPTIYMNGAYPVLTMNHTATSNTNHGPTIQFTFDGLTTGGSTSRQILIGTPGNGSHLDFGFSGGGFGSNSDYNPHRGIAGYEGVTPMRLFSNGLMVGSNGTYPSIASSISYNFQVNGTGYVSSNFTVGGTFTENSSIRYKKDIETISYGLDKVLQMRGVTYLKKENDIKEVGVIAEEIAEIFPELVNYDTEGRPDSVSYGRITGLLIEAIKDLKKEINDLKNNG